MEAQGPSFLNLPKRARKPRTKGVTHVLDKGLPRAILESWLDHAGSYVDILKVGWGIGYVDPSLKERVTCCQEADVSLTLGGTLLEIAVQQGRLGDFCRWAQANCIEAVEVSNGLALMGPGAKRTLVRQLSRDFLVLAETGLKGSGPALAVEDWVVEMEDDLEAGATWLVAEGRESGTQGLYRPDGSIREELVDAIADRLGHERVIFEAPQKAQQVWFLRRFGPETNLGNIPPEEILALETLRLGLRADTVGEFP